MSLLVPDFSRVQVLVVGDIMLDRYWTGDAERISPEAPIPVVKVNETNDRPGGAANVALNVTSYKANATLIGMIGNDREGEILESLLTDADVRCVLQHTKIAPTITKLRILSRHQQLLRVDFEQKPITFSPEEQLRQFKQHLTKADVIILSDYRKGTLDNAVALIKAAKQANIPVLVDPKQHDFSHYQGASLLTPNMREFEAVVGSITDNDDLEQKAQQQIQAHELQGLLITRSEKGMSLILRDQPMINIPTKAQEVYDVTGAGDTVIATLACSIAAGESWLNATMLANFAAGVSISKIGAATVTPRELQRSLQHEQTSISNIIDRNSCADIITAFKARNKTVVMTNGCFDLLHPGHVHYLEAARRLGDVLIVAVNDDASVQRLKGSSRPVNALNDRMALLASLKAVDYVVAFSEDTPEALYKQCLPDTLVKGGDYQPEQVVGGAAVIANGGQVKILSFKDGYSSSSIINKIREEQE